jgi:hypothetical protein
MMSNNDGNCIEPRFGVGVRYEQLCFFQDLQQKEEMLKNKKNIYGSD